MMKSQSALYWKSHIICLNPHHRHLNAVTQVQVSIFERSILFYMPSVAAVLVTKMGAITKKATVFHQNSCEQSQIKHNSLFTYTLNAWPHHFLHSLHSSTVNVRSSKPQFYCKLKFKASIHNSYRLRQSEF